MSFKGSLKGMIFSCPLPLPRLQVAIFTGKTVLLNRFQYSVLCVYPSHSENILCAFYVEETFPKPEILLLKVTSETFRCMLHIFM